MYNVFEVYPASPPILVAGPLPELAARIYKAAADVKARRFADGTRLAYILEKCNEPV